MAIWDVEVPTKIKRLGGNFKRPGIAFTICFVLSAIAFFPINRLQGLIIDKARAAGLRLYLGPISLGAGIFPSGGLIAIRSSGMKADIAFGRSLECDEVKISPQIWRLLLLKVQAAIRCTKKGAGTMLITYQSGFPFKVSEPSIDVDLDDVDLESFGEPLGVSGLKGLANGSISVSELQAGGRSGLPGQLSVDLEFSKLTTPAFSEPAFNLSLPTIQMGSLAMEMSLNDKNLNLEKFAIGANKNAQIFGEFKGKFVMKPSPMGGVLPVGDLAGRLKIDKDLEEAMKDGTNFNLLFGPIKENGFREFKKKKLTEAPQSLVMPPVE